MMQKLIIAAAVVLVIIIIAAVLYAANADAGKKKKDSDPLSFFGSPSVDQAMPGSNLQILSGIETPQDCAKKCLDYEGCKSIDYQRGKGVCHLGSANIAEKALYASYPGWDYYEKK